MVDLEVVIKTDRFDDINVDKANLLMRCRFAVNGDTLDLNVGTVHANLLGGLKDIGLHHDGAGEFERLEIGSDEHVIVDGFDALWQPFEIISHISSFLK